MISAAGGLHEGSARSAIFNGANIVVANVVQPGDGLAGISAAGDITALAKAFLETIE